MTDHIVDLPVAQLRESPFNPRRTFAETRLQELADDIRSQGVLSPLLVRPYLPNILRTTHDPDDGFELVFGHRRLRAAQMAGLETVPCMVRAMSDLEVKRAQISENLAREDVHPIEEAEGFQALMRDHGVTAEELAQQTGKSLGYVYGRLKLLQACSRIRDACLKGEIGSEAALLIARLRTERLQHAALAKIQARNGSITDGGVASTRRLREILLEEFTLGLKDAVFDTADADLLPAAGACTTCPKRSGNAPEFEDIATMPERKIWRGGDLNEHRGGDNVCTDPDCFQAKKAAHFRIQAERLKSEGKVVVEGTKARQALAADGTVKGAYIALKEVRGEIAKLKKRRQGDLAAPVPEVVVIQDPRTGKTIEAVKRADVEAAGIQPTPKQARSNDRWEREQREHAEAAAREATVRQAILARVREAIAATPRSTFDLRLVASHLLDWADRGTIAVLNLADKEDLDARVAAMEADVLAHFMLDLIIARGVLVDRWSYQEPAAALMSAAEHYGVDVEAIRAEVLGESSTPSKAGASAKKAVKSKSRSKTLGKPDAAVEPGAWEEEQTDDAADGGEMADEDDVPERDPNTGDMFEETAP